MLRKRLLYTRIIVTLSILGTLGSYYTIPKGWGEIYPFYTYKLFSQPLGTNHTVTEYRIYAKKDPEDTFHIIPVKETASFQKDEYAHLLQYLTDQYSKDTLNGKGYKEKLQAFVKEVVPGMAAYRIVSETYNPKDLLLNNIPYDTATVICF